MVKPLSETEKLLISRLLNLAADTFSCHGANDYDLTDLPRDDRAEILRSVEQWNGTPEDFDETRVDYSYDWLLMCYFAHRILGVE